MMYEVKFYTGEELEAKLAELAAAMEDAEADEMADEMEVVSAMENGVALW